jgi:hypothetical protein
MNRMTYNAPGVANPAISAAAIAWRAVVARS